MIMMHWRDYVLGIGYGWPSMIIFGALIILGIVYIIKLIEGGGRKKQFEEKPLDIVKRRYAKGRVTKEQYEKIKDDLKND